MRGEPPAPTVAPVSALDAAVSDTAAVEAAALPEPEGAPEPTLASAKPASDRSDKVKEAKRLVTEGRRLVFSDAARAVALARKAVALHATQDGYALLGLAGCKDGDARAARTAYTHLRGSKREDLARICEARGVALDR